MISKELFNKVMDREVRIEAVLDSKPNELIYSYKLEGHDDCKWVGTYINIYELQHKVKEWLQKQTSFNINFRDDWWDRLEPKVYVDLYDMRKTFYADTEPEAIFLAGEWILKEHSKQDKKEV
jgi:hypothetical protein